MLDLLLRACRQPERAEPIDLSIAGGRITGVGRASEPARETIDVAGRLVTPGLVESHYGCAVGCRADLVVGSASGSKRS